MKGLAGHRKAGCEKVILREIHCICMGNENNWEKQINKEFNLEFDLDALKLSKFLGKHENKPEYIKEQELYELGLGKPDREDFKLNNAGILFFAREPQKFIEQSYITCVRYHGNGMANIIDRKDLYGDLFTLVDDAESFVKRHTRLAYKFEDFKRIDI